MSYRLKLILVIVLLIAVTFSLGGTVLIYASFQTFLNAETQAALDAYGSTVNTLCLLYAVGDDLAPETLGTAMAQLTGRNNKLWQAAALWTEQETLYQSGNAPLHREKIPMTEHIGYLPIRDEAGTGLLIGSRVPVGDRSFYLLGRFDLSQVYEARQVQQNLYILIYLVVLGVGLLITVVLAYALTGKLRRLTVAAKKLAAGNLSTRSAIGSADEFGQLSRNFDAMADRLQENIAALENSIQQQEQFMGAFSHEMKTPMTSIIGFADLLRQGNLDESTRMMAADYIYSEAHRLERLSLKMLDLLLLEKDSMTMKEVWLPSFLEEIERAMSSQLRRKKIHFICRWEEKTVELEPDLCKSLLYNLVDNASKAIEGEGIIVLKGAPIPGGCEFQVTDNGRGMEESELSRITDAFYRVDKARSRAQGGAGLGLALCKQIVALHHGSIRFFSVPGKGTRVQVRLYAKEGQHDEA